MILLMNRKAEKQEVSRPKSCISYLILDLNMTQNSFIFESTQHFNNIMLQGNSLEAFLFAHLF